MITAAEYEQDMDERQKQYAIAGGIRGPDLGNTYYLKQVFTARIRVLAGIHSRFVDKRYMPVNNKQAIAAIYEAKHLREITSGLSHYLVHVEEAAKALGDNDLAQLARLMSYANIKPETVIRLAGGDPYYKG